MNNCKIDAHIHFEHQEYSLDLIDKMVEVAINNGLEEIRLLDHTHKFKEFAFLYEEKNLDKMSVCHYVNKCKMPIKEYLDFIKLVKSKTYPIKIKFGLEVCYFKTCEEKLKEELPKYNFDFLNGSIHQVDGFAYDFGIDEWNGRDVDKLYQRFFESEEDLIKSGLFDHLSHPDSIKIYNILPSFDLHPYYKRIAKLLKDNDMSTENNTGFARYGYTNYGLNKDFLNILKDNGVTLYKSSDAHKYIDIANKFNEIEL